MGVSGWVEEGGNGRRVSETTRVWGKALLLNKAWCGVRARFGTSTLSAVFTAEMSPVRRCRTHISTGPISETCADCARTRQHKSVHMQKGGERDERRKRRASYTSSGEKKEGRVRGGCREGGERDERGTEKERGERRREGRREGWRDRG